MPSLSLGAWVIRSALLFTAMAGAPPDERAAAQEPAAAIVFELKSRGEGEAAEPKLAASPDGQVTLKVEGERFKGVVRLYDALTGKPLGPQIALSKPGLSYRVTAVAVAPDRKTIATAIGNLSNDWGRVEVWDATTGQPLARRGGMGEVFQVGFSADGQTVTILAGPPGGK